MIITSDPYLRLSADSTLYLNIAEKYLRGEFRDAINGYWNPLLSWLLIPFLYLGFSDVFAINSIYIIFGILTILGIWRLSYRFKLTEKIRIWVLISLLPIMLYYSFIQPFDLLLLCFLVYYLSIVFKDNYPEKVQNGILCGIIGSLAYLTKSYAFPFFITHFLSMNILHSMKNKIERKKVLKNAMAGFIVFFIISGTWVAVISNKYGYFTFSNMGKTNFAILGPEAPKHDGLEFGQPMFYKGFIEPPNKTAISAWEDPSYIEVKTWSPLESLRNFKHFIKLLLKNISHCLQIFESFSTLSIIIIIVYILLLIKQPSKLDNIISRGDLVYPLFTIFLYTGGYAFFHFEARYLWIVNILLLLMGGYLLSILLNTEFFENNMRKNILIFFFVISFIFVPSHRIISISKGNLDRDMYRLSEELKKYNIKGNIASNREYLPVHDAWHKTFRLTYWLNSKYYGQARLKITDEDLEKELKKYSIDYYFVWGDSPYIPEFLLKYKEITGGKIAGLKIFYLKDRKK
jgi:hypothetical protein